MEEQILNILRELFEDESLDETCTQKTCAKWDSMNHINLVITLEEHFGVSLDPDQIWNMTSFQEICNVISRELNK